jgi:tyrosyl-tRNA synthetase
VRKMSKSLDNWVALTEPPDEQFGKLMSIPDGLIVKYLRLCAPIASSEVDEVERGLADGSLHPNDQKRGMARMIVDLYHGEGAGEDAEAAFDLVHKRHETPQDVPEMPIDRAWAGKGGQIWLPRLLVATGLASTNGEARRAIAAGGVRLDGVVLDDADAEFDTEALRGKVLAFGKRRFVRLG